MKRIVLPPEFRQLLRSLPKAERKQIGQALTELEKSFGQPHQHRGLGVRPLRNEYYELRCGLSQRLVFSNSEEGLVCALLGNHEDVRRFLKRH